MSRIKNFPPSFFAIVMGMGGLSMAFFKAHEVFNINVAVSNSLFFIALAVFIILFVLFTIQLLKHKSVVADNLKHPLLSSFFPTLSISLLVLSIGFIHINSTSALYFWYAGAIIQLFFTINIIRLWFVGEHLQLEHINPAWYIPAVGNVIVPITGLHFSYTEISWFFFSVGMGFWIFLTPILFNRLFFHTPLLDKIKPALFITIAPPAIGFVSYVLLNDGNIDNFAKILYYIALFLFILNLSKYKLFINLDFSLSWWAYTFPLAALTIATIIYYNHTKLLFFEYLSYGLLVFTASIVFFISIKTILAIKGKKICVKHK